MQKKNLHKSLKALRSGPCIKEDLVVAVSKQKNIPFSSLTKLKKEMFNALDGILEWGFVANKKNKYLLSALEKKEKRAKPASIDISSLYRSKRFREFIGIKCTTKVLSSPTKSASKNLHATKKRSLPMTRLASRRCNNTKERMLRSSKPKSKKETSKSAAVPTSVPAGKRAEKKNQKPAQELKTRTRRTKD